MKKFYLSIAFLLPIIGANPLFSEGGIAPAQTAATAAEERPPSPSNSVTPNLRKIFLVSPTEAQTALDDATGFVGISPGKKIICFSQQNGQWLSGFLITPTMQKTLPATVCQTIASNGAGGPQIKDFSAINIPVATQPFNWKLGSASNPDEWYTPSGKPASSKDQGICTSTQNGDIGIAIRNQGSAHQCIFIGRSMPLADQTILVLAK